MSSCNENRLDITCTCSYRFGEGELSRIYDIASGEYVCCGNVVLIWHLQLQIKVV